MAKTKIIVGTVIACVVGATGAGVGIYYGLNDPSLNMSYSNNYTTKTKVGYQDEVLGQVPRHLPEVSDGGLETGYPKYGETLKNLTEQERSAIISENVSYCGIKTTNTGGSYDMMDSSGVLYLNGEALHNADGSVRKLFKHSASDELYEGNLSDAEPAITKKVTYKKRSNSGYGVTGMYAPAGELITVKISKEDMEATQGITIHIGQALFNGQANNIWSARELNRMPIILNTMEVNPNTATLGDDGYYTAYVGSFFGGPIYVRDENVTFSVTLSGGVRYSHFILGYTTKEEFELDSASSAPYFDLEVWENGVLHSGPKKYAEGFSYDDLYNVAVYWDKVALVSTQVTSQGVVFLYDPFVAAGAAVAFPGRSSVNCPSSWMSSSLNYNALVTNGAWGNMHEYNHNFQGGWGRGEGGEVTNNALNLVEYSLFTKISSARQIENFGASGLSDWNRYTSATWATNQAMSSKRENDLSQYATILHNFGQDMFIKSIKQQQSGGYTQNMSGWARAISEATHNNITYFFENLVPGYSIDSTTKALLAEKDYPTFIPVACAYQTGRSYMFDNEKRYITTQKPYQISLVDDLEDGKFTIDLRRYTLKAGSDMYDYGSIVLPSNFDYRIISVTPEQLNGALTETEVENVYTFMPNKEKYSGKIIVTLEIIPPQSANIPAQKVDLVLEFEQAVLNKNMLERTTYTYSKEKMYKSAVDAYENNYVGYTEKFEGDNINTVENSNTDLWYTNEEYDKLQNHVVEIKGKIYADEAGKYRIALRGRYNVALYISLDEGKTYKCMATYTENPTGDYNFSDKKETYCDLELESGTWVYFKEVMLGERYGKISFVGLGWGKYTPPVPIFDNNPDPAKRKIVGEEPAKVTIKYASAYRNSYEIDDSKFETPYFYTREYSYDYVDNTLGKNKSVSSPNFQPATDDPNVSYALENLVDGNPQTTIHTNYLVSESNPLDLVLDLHEVVTANRIILKGRNDKFTTGNLSMPSDFVITASVDGTAYFKIGEYENQTYTGRQMELDIPSTKFRYISFHITRGETGRYVALSGIDFTYSISGFKQLSPDDESLSFKGAWNEEHILSNFGHVLVGKKKYRLEFDFNGSQFGIISAKGYANNFEVRVDGKKIGSINLKNDSESSYVSFMSNPLASGKHHVEIKCLDSASVDSIIIK